MFSRREPGPPILPSEFALAPFSPFVLRSWHALAHAGRRLASAASLIAAGVAIYAAPVAAAAPSVTTRPLAAPTGATAATKPRGKSTAAKTKARRAAAKTARRTTARARTRPRTAPAARTGRRATPSRRDPAPRVAAETEPALVVPAVDLPNLALATPAASWETALTASPPAAGTVGPLVALSRSATSLLDNLMSRARGQLGTRYVYGAAAPGAGLDCSSFVRYVMEAMNVRLPRTADEQAQAGRAIPRDRAQLRPGDLLTFGRGRRTSHVGIYLGEGRFIHASVSSGRVIETTIDRNQALFRRWQGARRLIAGAEPDSAATAAERGG